MDDRPLSKVHVPGLDTLRGVAILAVLFHNLSFFAPSGGRLEKVWNGLVESGWVGVQLFFVLSGFLITGILVDDREKPRGLRVFYIRRFLRIFPLYYALLVIYFLILPLAYPGLKRPVSEGIWYWLYLSNWSWLYFGILPGIGHLWSLAVEEQFYIAWPWVAVRTRQRTLAIVCMAIVVGALVVRAVLHLRQFPDLWLYSATICRFDALAMGALVALAFRSEVWRPRLERALLPAGILAAAALGVLMVITHGMNRNNPLIQIWGYSIIGLGSAVLVAAAARPAAPSWVDNGALRFFGKYSYGIYIAHPPLKHVVMYFFGPRLDVQMAERPVLTDLVFIVVLTLASIVVALLSWVALERPMLSLKDRIAPR